jgi:hypothetical protein
VHEPGEAATHVLFEVFGHGAALEERESIIACD